jgi:hypothetical protein
VGVSDTRRHTDFAAGFLCSVVLHGLILLPFVLERHGTVTNIVIPVEVVVLADQTANSEYAPQKEVGATSSPGAVPLGVSSLDERPDDFELKLQRLAELRQPGMDARISNSHVSPKRAAPMSDTMGQSNVVSDFIRAQVERRWSLDLATLGNKTFSVLIRIQITGAGVVTRADIVSDARLAADNTYQDIARSARNAVLLSSPFALPSGHYGDAMELTLSLNTKDALR